MATNTGPGSAHRHKTNRGLWSDQTDVDSGSQHYHQVDLSAYATQADLEALAKRVTALESTTPPPVVPPVSSAWPAPTSTVQLPPSIDRTGATDMAAALMNFINSVPDGTAANRKAIDFGNGIYRYDSYIGYRGKHYLDFVGSRALMKQGGSVTSENGTPFYVQGSWAPSSFLRWHGIDVQGNCPNPAGDQGMHAAAGWLLDGGSDFEIYDWVAKDIWGDAVEFNSAVARCHLWDYNVASCGRNAFAIITASDILVEQGQSDVVGYCVYDIEPNNPSQSSARITFQDHTFKSWGNSFAAFAGDHGAVIDAVTLQRIKGVGASLFMINGDANSGYPPLGNRSNFVLTDLSSDKPQAGPVIRMHNVQNIRLALPTIKQPLSSGSLHDLAGSTGITLV